ncbi:MAG: hypothetical protein ACPG2Y_02745 [Acholeplasmataceae bacterium]
MSEAIALAETQMNVLKLDQWVVPEIDSHTKHVVLVFGDEYLSGMKLMFEDER